CGERSGGARREPRGQMVARSSLLRRPTSGARPARRTSSVVAALAALAPRLVRLAHHGYPDRLLAELERREREQRAHHRDDPEADDDLRLGPAEELEVVMDGRHAEDALAAELEGDHLPDHGERLADEHPAH